MSQTANPYNSPFEAQFDAGRAQQFIIEKLLRGVHTCQLVRVDAVQPATDRVGFVTVTPLLQETDTAGIVIEQTPIYNVPFLRYQGGASAVILDPEPGDIGLALFAERDISTLKKTRAPGPAATNRAHSSADALYIGGMLNGAATQYVRFLPDGAGIIVHTPGTLNYDAAGGTSINGGPLTINVPTTFTETVSGTKTGAGAYQFPDLATANVPSLDTHVHGGVQIGGSDTSGPHN